MTVLTADEFAVQYSFEDLEIFINGKRGGMFWGKADLADDGCDGFYVREIILDGGARLDRHGTGFLGLPQRFEAELFKRLAREIEESRHAKEFFASQLEEAA
jgi:hypothetical protein